MTLENNKSNNTVTKIIKLVPDLWAYFNRAATIVKEKEKLAHLQQIIGEQYNAMVDIVYSKLDGIVQSSALVETINSIVRSYLNTTRNHISQNLLTLIMFYHPLGKKLFKTY